MERRGEKITVIRGHHLKYLNIGSSWELNVLIRQAETSWVSEYGERFVKDFTYLLIDLLYQPERKVKVVANQLDSFCASCLPRKQKECVDYLQLHPEHKRRDIGYIRHLGLTDNKIYEAGWLCSRAKNIGFPISFL